MGARGGGRADRHELERLLLFGLVERPSRGARLAAWMRRSGVLVATSVVALLAGPAAAAWANTFLVSNNANSGAGSLRQAIRDANAAAAATGQADTITVAPGVGSLVVQPLTQLPALAGVNLLNGQGLL